MHVPVLTKEVIEYLNPEKNENFIDCTIGQAGHSKLVLEKTGPGGKVLGIDMDPRQIEKSRLQLAEFGDRAILISDSYANLKKIVEENNFYRVSGILLDLGMSSEQLENSGRGFSFKKNEPLDMRYGAEFSISNFQFSNLTAEKIVNEWRQEDIERILKEYGEEKFARQITNKIIEARKIKPIKTTFELIEIIERALPKRLLHGRIHFATKTFQALRITVNDELNNLKKVLPQTLDILEKGGRMAIISFHSLEDRIVKNFLKDSYEGGAIEILTKKPITPSGDEIVKNHSSRSAKLRAAAKK
ncbi:MAG: 16S rRNA (cytosine(1402)-N(4))-methyltransferase RsmH [Candidatus Staskawiczbacteria bacterium]|nr:16S rRNA (cytosine(1402)-N(4))-methyltransferase RsmH [Candidatus Staskawiczbacteria bacterium]